MSTQKKEPTSNGNQVEESRIIDLSSIDSKTSQQPKSKEKISEDEFSFIPSPGHPPYEDDIMDIGHPGAISQNLPPPKLYLPASLLQFFPRLHSQHCSHSQQSDQKVSVLPKEINTPLAKLPKQEEPSLNSSLTVQADNKNEKLTDKKLSRKEKKQLRKKAKKAAKQKPNKSNSSDQCNDNSDSKAVLSLDPVETATVGDELPTELLKPLSSEVNSTPLQDPILPSSEKPSEIKIEEAQDQKDKHQSEQFTTVAPLGLVVTEQNLIPNDSKNELLNESPPENHIEKPKAKIKRINKSSKRQQSILNAQKAAKERAIRNQEKKQTQSNSTPVDVQTEKALSQPQDSPIIIIDPNPDENENQEEKKEFPIEQHEKKSEGLKTKTANVHLNLVQRLQNKN